VEQKGQPELSEFSARSMQQKSAQVRLSLLSDTIDDDLESDVLVARRN